MPTYPLDQIEPIYPPSLHVLPNACDSCGGDVRCDKGFAVLSAKPGTYLCSVCTGICGWSPLKRWVAMREDYWKKCGPLR